ncbi:transcriptional regulator [Methylobacterium sp. Leaf113]|uniref:transcriptional regulator n=1 Tax=Methylobacterium sp. Leaf113 TaxID=1736259 RepID=UPI000A57298D|nr:transcriptional regulator [Methylobacterium sp. Leaf113]
MRDQLLSTEDVLAQLREACAAAGGNARWARRHGVSDVYVGDVLHGRRGPGESILRALGLRRCEPLYVVRTPKEIALHDADGVTLVTAMAD